MQLTVYTEWWVSKEMNLTKSQLKLIIKEELGSVLLSEQTLPKITLKVEKADIQEVLKFFAEQGRRNIVAGDNVSGNVSVDFKDELFEDALSSTLQQLQFTYLPIYNIYLVGTKQEIKKQLSVPPIHSRGPRLSVSFKAAGIQEVMKFLKEQGNLIFTGESHANVLKGTVSMHLRGIRMSHILDLILRTRGLTVTYVGKTKKGTVGNGREWYKITPFAHHRSRSRTRDNRRRRRHGLDELKVRPKRHEFGPRR